MLYWKKSIGAKLEKLIGGAPQGAGSANMRYRQASYKITRYTDRKCAAGGLAARIWS